MPIYAASYLLPKTLSGYVAEDSYLKGGFRVLASAAERDAIAAPFLKAGMLVRTQDNGKMWILDNDLTTWNAFESAIAAASSTTSGLLSASDKSKLDSLVASVATSSASGYMSAQDKSKLDSLISTVATPSASGYMSSTDKAKLDSLTAAVATTSTLGYMSAADKAKLDGIAAGANNYVHPTGDGNLHVPATGTTNSGKVLTAGATAGSLSWTTVTGGGSGTVTSVGGTGSVNGLTLSGTVTTAGSLTLGGAVTSVDTASSFQMNALGIGCAAPAAGELRVLGDITAFYSDGRLKTIKELVPHALLKVCSLRGVIYEPNEIAQQLGFAKKEMVGLIAQDVEAVLPQAVAPAPFDVSEEGFSISGENYKAVQYEKLIPVLVEAIKELSDRLEKLEK